MRLVRAKSRPALTLLNKLQPKRPVRLSLKNDDGKEDSKFREERASATKQSVLNIDFQLMHR